MTNFQQTAPVPSLTRTAFVPDFKKHIGVDAFSNVFKIKIRRDTQHEAAGRLIALKLFKEDPSVVEDAKSLKSRELRILQMIGAHDFIVRFFGMYLDDGLFVGLLFEYAELGNWEDFIYEHMIDNDKNFYDVRCYQAKCLALGLAHLRSRDIVHGDVFIENALVFEPNFRLKIANFGSSFCALDQEKPPSFPYNVDDIRLFYLAPEKRLPSGDGRSSSSFKTDVFSFGVLLFFAFFQDHDCLKQYTTDWNWNALKGEIEDLVRNNEGFPSAIAQIIVRCLKTKPEVRMSIEDVPNVLDQLNCSKLDQELLDLHEFVNPPGEFNRMHSSTSATDFTAYALARPMSLASYFSAQGMPPPVYGAVAVSPLSPFFPNFEKRGLMDPYSDDMGRTDVPFQRATGLFHHHLQSINVEHKPEDVDPKKLQGARDKASDIVIKAIMNHRDIQENWRSVLIHLDMKENDIRLVEDRAKEHRLTSESIDQSALVHYALDAVWLEQKFESATREKLLDALLKAKCYDSAFTFLNLDYDLD